MLVREEVRNTEVERLVAAAQPVPELGPAKRKGGLEKCPLGCDDEREYSDLARHKLTKLHLKAEAEAAA